MSVLSFVFSYWGINYILFIASIQSQLLNREFQKSLLIDRPTDEIKFAYLRQRSPIIQGTKMVIEGMGQKIEQLSAKTKGEQKKKKLK